MTLLQNQLLFSQDIAKLLKFIAEQGYGCTLGEAWRSQEQAELYAKEGKGIVDSLHCKRLALDLNLISAQGVYLSETASYEPFGTFWQSLDSHNRWGGKFPKADGNHFERKEA